MNLLVLGGTIFVGRWLVQAALERGHRLTLFNRGKSNPDLFPEVEKLRGERDGDLSALEGRRWDAVVDTNGYVPRIVRRSAELLAGSVGSYTFISSLSVYADFSKAHLDESGAVGVLADPATEEVNGETYGPLKVACERAVQEVLLGKALVVRPGLIVGPYDPTDRFTYWPRRVARGGEVLAPGRPERGVQFVDVRDLAEWILHAVEMGATGVYNANGPEQPVPMEALLSTCKTASGSDASFTWVSEAFLQQEKVGEWIEMPLWVPESNPEYAGFFAFDSSKAIAGGLRFRPLVETVRATLEWEAGLPADRTLRAGMAPEREAELLKKWRAIHPSDHPPFKRA
jgi:2'-hydroxyisoflavone reductase